MDAGIAVEDAEKEASLWTKQEEDFPYLCSLFFFLRVVVCFSALVVHPPALRFNRGQESWRKQLLCDGDMLVGWLLG